MTKSKGQKAKDKIMKLGDVEIDQEPAFELESKVRVRKKIRNDGTFPGRQIGEVLANKGDEGYIISIGTYLQTAYIYSVHFLETGNVVGCLGKELELITDKGENYVNQHPKPS